MDTRTGEVFDLQPGDKLPAGMVAATTNTPGHRQLSDHEATMVRKCRQLGTAIEAQMKYMTDDGSCDGRWLSIAKTHFQEGLQAAVRAVTKPDFF